MSKEWKLVPVEPTDEMKEAGAPSCEYTGTVCAALCYEAMIADAPAHIGDAAEMVAPVIERQDPAAYLVTDVYGQKKALRAGAEGIERHRNAGSNLVPLYTSPPELAELQATIERLRAELGECKGEYDRAVNKVDTLRDQLEQAQSDLVRMMDGRDGLRSTLDEANKVIAWQRDEKPDLARFAAAEQRNSELVELLRMAWGNDDVSAVDCRRIDAACAKPAKS